MKHLHYLIYILTLLLGVTVSSCRDDLDYLGGGISDETTVVRLALDFSPASEGLTRTSYDGDAIRDIDDLCLVIFGTDGSFHSVMPIDIASVSKADIDRVPGDASNGQLAGEVRTSRVSVDLDLPLGTYYIHALANIRRFDSSGNVIQTTEQYLRELFPDGDTHPMSRAEFCALKRQWDDTSIQANSELTGYVVNADDNGKSPSPSTLYGTDDNGTVKLPGTPVVVTKGLNVLHGWLRRMASKVTVTFDASQLSDNISVYIHDIRLHDIPAEAPLLTYGEVTDREKLIKTDSQYLAYCPEEDMDAEVSRWNELRERWPELTRANWSFDANDGHDDTYKFPHLEKMTHSNSAKSLYLYENMQGEGESKLQDVDGGPDGVIDSPDSWIEGEDHYKDNKLCGTYVEVRGYYVNGIKGEESRGPIVYRFMLGKDKLHNFDVERNYHYKLTLQLKGRANEVDWHIEYYAEEDDIYIPSPYYISYGYNQSLDLPIKVKGHITEVKATIIQNNWYPNKLWNETEVPEEWKKWIDDVRDNPYTGYIDANATPKVPKATALGFLTLFQPQSDAIGIGVAPAQEQDANPYLLRYWTGQSTAMASGLKNESRGYPLYTRTYTLGDDNGTVRDEGDKGTWSYTRDRINGQEYTHVFVPLYTRERNLVKTVAYTGQNPFIAYQRRAKVQYDIKFRNPNGTTRSVTKIVDIVQVARVANPTAIWRSWNNSRPFHVAINLIDGDDNDTYHTLESRGGWSAEVTVGNDWILLNGGRQKIYGANRSKIEFDMRPAGILSSEKESRYAIIEVKYHDYSCVHRIFVRQGYAPIQVNEGAGNPYWHSYNLETKNTEGRSPLDEGSLFRYGKPNFPIASSNNYNDKNPWINVEPEDFLNANEKVFTLANGNASVTWDEISSKGKNKPFLATNSVTLPDGTTGRIMVRDDVIKLRDNKENAFAYGIMYGDEATTTLFNINEVYGYRGYLSHQQYGMRGVIVYNMNTGAQVFFPIGASGYGRRQGNPLHKLAGFKGVLKYAGAGRRYDYEAHKVYQTMKLFYTLYKGNGAIYWFNEVDDTSTTPEHDETDKGALGLDINYFTLDFNPITVANVIKYGSTTEYGVNGVNGSDACFLRLVQDYAP